MTKKPLCLRLGLIAITFLFLTNARAEVVEPQPSAPETVPSEPSSYLTIPGPDLSECALLGRKIAYERYTSELRKDTAEIFKDILPTSTLYGVCHLFSGSARNACCDRIMNRTVDRCQEQVKAREAAESPCAPREIDCRLLRPFKCALERTIERKRVQCCISIDGQVLQQLFIACASATKAASTGCHVQAESNDTMPVASDDVEG